MATGRGNPGSVGPGPGKGARPGSGDGNSGSDGFLGGNSGCGGCGTGSSGPGQFGSAACKRGINSSSNAESSMAYHATTNNRYIVVGASFRVDVLSRLISTNV